MFDPSTGECRILDDVDFSEAEQTVSFHLDGLLYEIALSADNMEKLRTQLKPYIRFGHIVARDHVRKTPAAHNSDTCREGAS